MPATARKATTPKAAPAVVPALPHPMEGDPFKVETPPAYQELTGDELALLAAYRAGQLPAVESIPSTVETTQDSICDVHFPQGWPEGQAAVSCQHGDDHRHYYRNGAPPAAPLARRVAQPEVHTFTDDDLTEI